VYAGGCLGPFAFGATAATAGYPTAWLGAATAMVLAAALMLVGRRLLVRHARTAPRVDHEVDSATHPHESLSTS
ncbi:MAG: hypothetical protein IRY92_00840, partial [Dactylosporangium sp.]|nr:hypothetical protein [Dactylosporangium sp.]